MNLLASRRSIVRAVDRKTAKGLALSPIERATLHGRLGALAQAARTAFDARRGVELRDRAARRALALAA